MSNNELTEKEIVLDLEALKKNEDILSESFLRMYGAQIEHILKQMFDIPIFGPNAYVKGKPKDIRALAKALGSEKKYIKSAKKFGLDDPKTYKTKSSLSKAVKGFEKMTGLRWPFK